MSESGRRFTEPRLRAVVRAEETARDRRSGILRQATRDADHSIDSTIDRGMPFMFDAHSVRELIEDRGSPRISIFLPTHERGPETKQDPIRLANLLDEAQRALENGDFGREATGLLAPARSLLKDEDFWQHQSRGLALFFSPDGMRRHRLPIELREKVVVSERFHVKPLLPLLTGDGRFHVLALSQARVRLFDASRDSIRAIDLHDVPESLRDVVGYDWEEKSLQFHSAAAGARAGGAGPGVIFHGHGSGKDDTKPEVKKYIQAVDRGVLRLLHDRGRPLVLAAVEYVAAMFRATSKHPNITDEIVEGNPDRLSPEELRDAAWKIVEPLFQAARDAATARYRELGSGSTPHTSDELETIVPAAFAGRVQTLFVARDVEQWGRYDPDTTQILLHGRPANGDDDLLDVAAAETLVRDGEIYALDAEDMPGSPIAAIFRY
jgi:hypothetical protein